MIQPKSSRKLKKKTRTLVVEVADDSEMTVVDKGYLQSILKMLVIAYDGEDRIEYLLDSCGLNYKDIALMTNKKPDAVRMLLKRNKNRSEGNFKPKIMDVEEVIHDDCSIRLIDITDNGRKVYYCLNHNARFKSSL